MKRSYLFILTYSALLFLFPPIIQVFAVIVLALYLFTTEKFPIDITSFYIMILLIILGLVSPEEGVSGFSNAATITVLSMFILSGGIEKTGVIHKLGRLIFGIAKKNLLLQILLIGLIAAPISGLFNNTAVVAIFLPMIVNFCIRHKIHATKLLIPLSYTAMLGGTLTVIGTSSNILANSILADQNLPTFSMFEFSIIGLIVLAVGLLYFVTIGHFLLPERKSETQASKYKSNFFAELQIQEGSEWIGKNLHEIKFIDKYEAKVFKLIRNNKSYIRDAKKMALENKDVIVFYADEQKIIELEALPNSRLLLDFDPDRRHSGTADYKMAKVVVPGKYSGRKLDNLDFHSQFGISIVGIHRDELNVSRLADMRLHTSEIFLVKAPEAALEKVRKSNSLILLEEVDQQYDREKTWKAIVIMLLVVGLAALNILPIMVSALLGVFLMFITGCLSSDEVYKSVNWEVIFLLAGLIPLGIAIENSGAAALIANSIVNVAGDIQPIVLLAALYLITTLLTEVISNNAAIVLLVPIAINVAMQLNLNPLALTLIVMFASSTSFLSPVGYQTNTMVYGAGNYKFTDFFKVGFLLNLILMVVTSFAIYYFIGL